MNNQNIVGIVVGEDKQGKYNTFMYSPSFKPSKIMEQKINGDEDLNKTISILNELGFKEINTKTIRVQREEWNTRKEEIQREAVKLVVEKEKEIQVSKKPEDKIIESKTRYAEKKSGVKNLKIWYVAIATALVAATGYAFVKSNNNFFENEGSGTSTNVDWQQRVDEVTNSSNEGSGTSNSQKEDWQQKLDDITKESDQKVKVKK